MKNIFLHSLLLFTFSCATAPSRDEMRAQIQGYKLPGKPLKNEGIIYVIRPSFSGTLVRFNVFLDEDTANNEMGWNRGSQHIYFYAPAGRHTITSKAENNESIIVNVKAGHPTFVIQEAQFGWIMARNYIRTVDGLEGRFHMQNTEKGTIKKFRLKK